MKAILLSTFTLIIFLFSVSLSTTNNEFSHNREGQTVSSSFAEPPELTPQANSIGSFFVPNVGQINAPVQFVLQGSNIPTQIKDANIIFQLNSKQRVIDGLTISSKTLIKDPLGTDDSFVTIRHLGTNSGIQGVGVRKTPTYINYFVGNDSTRWRTNVSTYSEIAFVSLYPGIDVSYSIDNSGLIKSTYNIAPFVDPRLIMRRFEGVRRITIDAEGDLLVTSSVGDKYETAIAEKAPIAWQTVNGKRQIVTARYVVLPDSTVTFAVEAYDKSKALIIDPELLFASNFGRGYASSSTGVTVDGAGSVYVVGYSQSAERSDSADAFLAKMNQTGQVAYVSYFGGDREDFPIGVDTDYFGNVYVAGNTLSSNFPVLHTFNGGCPEVGNVCHAGFLARFDPQGAQDYGEYVVTGIADKHVNGIAVDKSRSNGYWVWLTGITSQSTVNGTFPTTFDIENAPNPASPDAYVYGTDIEYSKQSNWSQAIVMLFYLGGTKFDEGEAIAVDQNGDVFVAGRTQSPDLPVNRPENPCTGDGCAYGDNQDTFIARIRPHIPVSSPSELQKKLAYVKYFGSLDFEDSSGIAIDKNGNAYVVGSSTSNTLPALGDELFPGSTSGYVLQFRQSDGLFQRTHFLGGDSYDTANAVAVNQDGKPYIVGTTLSGNFPVQQPLPNGEKCVVFPPPLNNCSPDMFVVGYSDFQNSPTFSSYLGGDNGDNAVNLAIGLDGGVYIAGNTNSSNFPGLTRKASVSVYEDVLAKIKVDLDAPPLPTPTPKPWDLTSENIDRNHLPLNPKWGWQISQSISEPPREALEDCGHFHYTPPGPVFLGTDPCTKQHLNVDVINPNFFTLFGLCGPDDSNTAHGHVNWRAATLTGTVRYSNYQSAVYEDGDINLEFTPSNSGLITRDNRNEIELEFNADETTTHFSSPWWKNFSKLAGKSTAGTLIDGHEAVVIGLVGLDTVHGSKSEVHPVYAIAIRISKPDQVDFQNDGWAFFVRNKGNEGMCSDQLHSVDVRKLTMALPPPLGWKPSSVSLSPGIQAFANYNDSKWNIDLRDSNQVLVTFNLPGFSESGVIHGEVYLNWSGQTKELIESTQKSDFESQDEEPEEDSPENTLKKVVANMTIQQRETFLSFFTEKPTPVMHTLTATLTLDPAPPIPESDPVEVAEPDPLHTQSVNTSRVMEALCLTFAGHVPLPGDIENCNGFTFLYLPIITRNPAPDLVITALEATSREITITIQNTGPLPANKPFWVDLYVNPTSPPTGVNQIWNDGRSIYGGVWGVKTIIPPGASIVLTTNDRFYDKSLSKLPGVLKEGTPIYVQVDSANTLSNYGAILETHELENGAYNNILGPVSLSFSLARASSLEPELSTTFLITDNVLPTR